MTANNKAKRKRTKKSGVFKRLEQKKRGPKIQLYYDPKNVRSFLNGLELQLLGVDGVVFAKADPVKDDGLSEFCGFDVHVMVAAPVEKITIDESIVFNPACNHCSCFYDNVTCCDCGEHWDES